jgi:hypothetical protein
MPFDLGAFRLVKLVRETGWQSLCRSVLHRTVDLFDETEMTRVFSLS